MFNSINVCCIGLRSWDQRIFKGMLDMLPTDEKWSLSQNENTASVWFIDIDNSQGQAALKEARYHDDKVIILFTRDDLKEHAMDFAVSKPLCLKPLLKVLNQAGRAVSYKTQLQTPNLYQKLFANTSPSLAVPA
jgi:hypothetical protein